MQTKYMEKYFEIRLRSDCWVFQVINDQELNWLEVSGRGFRGFISREFIQKKQKSEALQVKNSQKP